MTINRSGLDLIKHFEGLYLKAYYDPVGILTIGYGHTGSDVKVGLVISEERAEELLIHDLEESEDVVEDLVAVELTDDQLAALVSFVFNVGRGNFKGSTLLRKLNASDFEGAAHEFSRWIYGTVNGAKKELKGLVRRRAAERALFLGRNLELPGARMAVSAAVSLSGDTAGPSGSGNADDYDGRFAAFIQSKSLKYFKPYEFLVMGNQHSNVNSSAHGLNSKPPEKMWENISLAATVLDRFRELVGAPVSTSSVYRNEWYNAAIGGAKNSRHSHFDAIDFTVKSNSSPADWASILRQLRQEKLFKGGIGTYKTFVHLDTRGVDVDW